MALSSFTVPSHPDYHLPRPMLPQPPHRAGDYVALEDDVAALADMRERSYCHPIARALTALTGQDFGDDPAAWEAWVKGRE